MNAQKQASWLVFIICLLGSLRLVAQPVTTNYFNPDLLKNTVSYLASDSMKGRANFSPELERLSLHIAAGFHNAGLTFLDGYSSYLIPFIGGDPGVKHFEEVWMNNKLLNDKDYFFRSAFYTTPTIYYNQFTKVQLPNIEGRSVIDVLNSFIDTTTGPLLILLQQSQQGQLKYIKKHQNELHIPQHTLLVVSQNEAANILVRLNPDVRQKMLFNVVGVLPGENAENKMVIISAHYDHVGVDSNVKGADKIFNGANDNASGTAAMLSLMRYFADHKDNNSTLVFIAFAGEELGLQGSAIMSNFFSRNNVSAMFNLEMLGKPDEKGQHVVRVTNFDQSYLGSLMVKNCKSIVVTPDDNASAQLAKRSDHYPFALRGIAAHTFLCFSSTDNTYHKPGDEASTLDYENMSALITGMLPGMLVVINGKDGAAGK